MSDAETLRIYDTNAADYAKKNQDELSSNQRLLDFITACRPGGRVLDLGCGPGTSAAVMAKAGLKPDATDASTEMVALAKAHAGVNALQASFEEITGDDLYEGIWASFSLLHAPRSAMPGHLAAIKRALRPGGVFYIGLKMGKGEARDALGRLYTYYEEDELKDLLKTAGFTVLDCTFGESEGLDGVVAPWISVATHG
ncbi:class I SAM-dependent DNA methyltransferase [Pseudophaeobacter sp.]|uniref:class I SAM-dependent DNA methyltransferase n=1 Tax=Pseudophaeobacter sp. TaxID=1971739 RepID=UPI004057E1A9